MTVAQLIEILKEYPQHLPVSVLCEGYGNEFLATKNDIRYSRVFHGGGNYTDTILLGIV